MALRYCFYFRSPPSRRKGLHYLERNVRRPHTLKKKWKKGAAVAGIGDRRAIGLGQADRHWEGASARLQRVNLCPVLPRFLCRPHHQPGLPVVRSARGRGFLWAARPACTTCPWTPHPQGASPSPPGNSGLPKGTVAAVCKWSAVQKPLESCTVRSRRSQTVVCRSEVTTAVHPRPDGADDPASLGSLPWMRRRHAVEAGSWGLRCCRIVWRRVDLK